MFDFAAVAPVKAPVRHCLVFHSASEMHDAFAAVVVGMIPGRLAGLVSPPPSISFFFSSLSEISHGLTFTGSVFVLLHCAPLLDQLSTFEFHPVFQELFFAFTEFALSLFLLRL